MWDLRNQILDAAKLLAINVEELTEEYSCTIKAEVSENFIKGGGEINWENFLNKESIQNDEAWRWVSDYIGDSEAILFFNNDDEKLAFNFLKVKM
ncbi:hypothetical protein [Paenibacillus sp. HB172176]|uniref:hypothetical protein n=1 Tax=Paenibacillus sp. HB172176 TaxID=2493690 RepID=UPI001F11011C|nr:hypothetical protein [Paenibacillus sp. HB172176]